MNAFFMETKKAGFASEFEAMVWISKNARRFGMTHDEAIARGFAQVFNV